MCEVESEPPGSTSPDTWGDMITGSLAVAEAAEPPPRWGARTAS